jgi:hypothetical protein
VSDPVTFVCPKCGPVLEALPGSLVTCGRCGGAAAPAGVDPSTHRRRVQDARRSRRLRRSKRDGGAAKAQVSGLPVSGFGVLPVGLVSGTQKVGFRL